MIVISFSSLQSHLHNFCYFWKDLVSRCAVCVNYTALREKIVTNNDTITSLGLFLSCPQQLHPNQIATAGARRNSFAVKLPSESAYMETRSDRENMLDFHAK